MSYINKDNTVYDNVDFSEPGLKELIDYVCSHFYGAAYAKVVDKKLIGFTIDGELYNLEDPDFTKKMGIKLYQIEKAVNDFDESFKGELPEHFSKEHLINHPRWIYARRQYGYVKEKEDEYLCPITGEEKTISFWLNLIGSSNGNFLSYPDDINLKQKVTYDEFALMFERIPFEQEKNYTEFIVKVFVGTYENLYGNKTDFSLLTEMLNEFLAYETPEEAFSIKKIESMHA